MMFSILREEQHHNEPSRSDITADGNTSVFMSEWSSSVSIEIQDEILTLVCLQDDGCEVWRPAVEERERTP